MLRLESTGAHSYAHDKRNSSLLIIIAVAEIKFGVVEMTYYAARTSMLGPTTPWDARWVRGTPKQRHVKAFALRRDTCAPCWSACMSTLCFFPCQKV